MAVPRTRALTVLWVVPLFAQIRDDLKDKLDEAQANASAEAAAVEIAPEPNDSERAIRMIRNRLHNTRRRDCAAGPAGRAKSDGCPPPPPTLVELPEGIPSRVTNVDLPPLSELPVNYSDTIVVGIVNRVQSFLSEDRTNIYTEFTITLSEVLRDVGMVGVKPGGVIALDRMGGAIRLPSGRVLRDVVHGQSAPLTVGRKYVLFLVHDARGAWFQSMKSWELWHGVAVPVDPTDLGTARQGKSVFTGKSEAEFIDAVREAVRGAK